MYLDFPVILYFIQSLQLSDSDPSINHSFPSSFTSRVHQHEFVGKISDLFCRTARPAGEQIVQNICARLAFRYPRYIKL